ncbi:MAG: aminoacyl-tRNA hydrolase [Anaerolineales bacterium]|jgi:PTH1 family peptidyl-tRNA hydrolase|nr:aminoacyl-tRNA hydrolase [Anaerolineales bacterium]
MKIIVGLGNPGRGYGNNRHNVGFKCVDRLAQLADIRLSQRRAKSQMGTGTINGQQVILAKPKTYMNLSGQAVQSIFAKFRPSLSDLVVIYDDLDLALGTIRIRERGSAGGHNGMKSIINLIGSQEFARIRVGIAPVTIDESGNTVIVQQNTKTPDYVLSNFTSKEKDVIKETCNRVAGAVKYILTEGITVAMNNYNNK